jgi:hypothetical protein
MHMDLKLLSLSLFFWGQGKELFLSFQHIDLQQIRMDTIFLGSILGLIGIAFYSTQIPAIFLISIESSINLFYKPILSITCLAPLNPFIKIHKKEKLLNN